ncbi:MAG: hypothetical protein WBD09_05690 [Halobacteriota archaeon]
MTNINPNSVFEPQRWGLSVGNTPELVQRFFSGSGSDFRSFSKLKRVIPVSTHTAT